MRVAAGAAVVCSRLDDTDRVNGPINGFIHLPTELGRAVGGLGEEDVEEDEHAAVAEIHGVELGLDGGGDGFAGGGTGVYVW